MNPETFLCSKLIGLDIRAIHVRQTPAQLLLVTQVQLLTSCLEPWSATLRWTERAQTRMPTSKPGRPVSVGCKTMKGSAAMMAEPLGLAPADPPTWDTEIWEGWFGSAFSL